MAAMTGTTTPAMRRKTTMTGMPAEAMTGATTKTPMAAVIIRGIMMQVEEAVAGRLTGLDWTVNFSALAFKNSISVTIGSLNVNLHA